MEGSRRRRQRPSSPPGPVVAREDHAAAVRGLEVACRRQASSITRPYTGGSVKPQAADLERIPKRVEVCKRASG
jgi:hypothetical protein